MHDTAKCSAIQGLSQKRSVRAVVFDYGNVLCLEQTLEDMKGMALVCGIPHERFSELYWKLRPPYDRGDIDGPAYWTAIVGQQELGLSRDQIATLIKLDSESITRPNQGAVQWAQLLHHEGFLLALLSNMPLELSRHVTKSFPSLSTFEYLIYSCDYGSIKPEPSIYRNCLECSVIQRRRFSSNCIIRNETRTKMHADGKGALGAARISQIRNAGKSVSSRGSSLRPDQSKTFKTGTFTYTLSRFVRCKSFC